MHVVFTVGTYYPLFSATSRCAKNLVDTMVKDHEVTVIAQQRWDSPKSVDDLGLAEHLRYISTGVSRARAYVDRRMNTRGTSKAWKCGNRFLAGVRYRETLFSPTACHKSEVNAYLRELERLNPKPDQLIPVSLPFEGVVACALYKQKNPEVVLTPVIFDQFSESATLLKTVYERRAKFEASVQLERKVAEIADRIFTVTWDEHIQKCMPDLVDKFQHIEHPMLIHDEAYDYADDNVFDEGLHAVYAGALNAAVRDPHLLTDLFEGFNDRTGIGLKLHSYAMGDGVSIVADAQKRSPRDIELCSPVAPSALLPIYASADLLVSAGNNVIDQKASKITEYMATGKPILHIAQRKDDPVISDIVHYPLGLVLYATDSIIENQEHLALFIKKACGKRVAFEEVAALFPEEVPSNVGNLILGGGTALCRKSFKSCDP